MDLQLFESNGWEVRIVEKSGEPWFIAKDICQCLELSNSREAVSKLDNDEKDVISNDTLGGRQNVTIVNESGMYALVFKSRKQEAKKFKKWVTSEVLPSIRKNGIYATDITIGNMIENPDFAIELLQKLKFERQEKELYLKQRNEAIKTKAEIGKKREATAMNTASQATKKVNRLEDELGKGKNYRTAKAIDWVSEIFSLSRGMWSVFGKKLTALSIEMDYEVKKIDSEDYGKVNSYHKAVIFELKQRMLKDNNMMGKYRKE